jgi:hypothetical protein
MQRSSDSIFLELERLKPGTEEFVETLSRYRAARRHEIEQIQNHEAAVAKWEHDRRVDYYKDLLRIVQKAAPPLFHMIWISCLFFWLFADGGHRLDDMFEAVFNFVASFVAH